jgi:hypothetical protein
MLSSPFHRINVPVRYVFSSRSNNNPTSQANTNGRRTSGCRRSREPDEVGAQGAQEVGVQPSWALSKKNGPRRPSPKFPRIGAGLVCGRHYGCEQLADGGDERIPQPLLPIRYRSAFSDKHWEPAKMKNSSCLFFSDRVPSRCDFLWIKSPIRDGLGEPGASATTSNLVDTDAR